MPKLKIRGQVTKHEVQGALVKKLYEKVQKVTKFDQRVKTQL